MINVPTPRTSRARRLVRPLIAASTLLSAVFVGTSAGPAGAVSDTDWLGVVNTYRAMSDLPPVTANSTWSAEGQAHSCYMLQNGISHDEIPGYPGYTPGGDIAGNSGNVAVSSAITATPRSHIDLWMTGPFHAIGILRHSLRSTGFGLCAQENTPTPWHSGATLDVIRGIDYAATRPVTPIVFPGDGQTVPLHSFITEYPNPLTMCGWSGPAGLPLFIMMPSDVTVANSSLTGPNGAMQTCTLHKGNVTDPTAKAILDGDNAVIVMPRDPLADGTYTATVNTNAGSHTWSFSVNRDAPLALTPDQPRVLPSTSPTADPTRLGPVSPFRLVDTREGLGAVRLRAGRTATVNVGGSDVIAVSANFTATQASARGYVTAYNCTSSVPTVSTVNYRPGTSVANQAVVPLQNGKLCLYSHADVDLVIDVNGFFYDGSTGSGFHTLPPARLLDTRETGQRFVGMQERRLRVTGVSGGAPTGANAVALNVTAVNTSSNGWLQTYPCGGASGNISSLNYGPNDTRPNSVVVPVSSSGEICIKTLVDTDVLVDVTGYFGAGGYDFVALDPVRLVDTREPYDDINPFTGGSLVDAGQVLRLKVAGQRGIPADAKAATVNLTAVGASERTYLTAYPCGTRPGTSNLNFIPGAGASANGAMVDLNDAGELCIYVYRPTHVIVDISGVWL